MQRRLALAAMAALVTICAWSASVRAGGWATVTLSQPIGETRVGEVISINFVVKQHGVTPIHDAYGEPVLPLILARHEETGELVQNDARRAAEIGHFTADIRFPRAGRWTIDVTPRPFAGSRLDAITVLTQTGERLLPTAGEEAAIPAATITNTDRAGGSRSRDTVLAAGLVTLVAAAGGFVLVRGRRNRPHPPATA